MAGTNPDGQNPDGTPPEGGSTPGGDGQNDYKKMYEQLQRTSQASYAGLQKTLAKVQGDYETLKSTNVATLEQFGELQKTHTAIQEAHDAMAKRLEIEIPEIASLREFKTRTELIHKKFPGLISFEADGLLPTGGTPEELEAKLKIFQEKLGNLAHNAEKENGEGSTPPPPGGGDELPTSGEALMKQAIIASGQGKMDEFDRLYTEAFKAGYKAPGT